MKPSIDLGPLEAKWREYAKALGVDSTPPAELRLLRRTFFMGACALNETLMEIFANYSETEALRAALLAEAARFSKTQ